MHRLLLAVSIVTITFVTGCPPGDDDDDFASDDDTTSDDDDATSDDDDATSDDDDATSDDDDSAADDDDATGDDDDTGPAAPDWTTIAGDTYGMGSNEQTNEQPIHAVTVPTFDIWRTEVTVAQFEACVDDGECSEPGLGQYCNWNDAGYEDHPVNCVDWYQAVDFCEWVGGRLPSESEWEFVARSRGLDIQYPWGNEGANCHFAVMDENGVGRGTDRTWEVCSKVPGHSDQDVCDMAGNVAEWVQDWYHDDYAADGGAPADGSAWESPATEHRVDRGGGLTHNSSDHLRAGYRYGYAPDYRDGKLGFRCAR